MKPPVSESHAPAPMNRPPILNSRGLNDAVRYLSISLNITMTILVIYWCTIELIPWTHRVRIEPANIAVEKGYAVIAPIRPPSIPLVELRSDSPNDLNISRLELFENDRRLGPPHTLHQNIWEQGGGRFSHWQGQIYFSSSDRSNPSTNGREYVAIAPIVAKSPLRLLGFISLVFLIVSAVRFLPGEWRQRIGTSAQWLHFVVAPRVPGRDRPLFALMALATVVAPLAMLLFNWQSGKTTDLAIAGFFPISDAAGYTTCAKSFIDRGDAVQEFCLRRPTYTSLLATLLSITGRNFHVALMLQALLVSLAILALAREVMRLAGPLGALLFLLLLSSFLQQHIFGLTLSENAGLLFGAMALTLLLRGAETGSSLCVHFGIFLFSVALNARPGAVFSLPMLVAWAGLWASTKKTNPTVAMLGAGAALAAGFGLHFLLIVTNGGTLANSHSNFAHTLYGLSVGGQGWTQILADHPDIASSPARVYRIAFLNIWSDPGIILRALKTNLSDYIGSGLDLGYSDFLLRGREKTWLWLAGAVAIASRFRDSRYSLIGLMTIGNLLSAPFIVQDGGQRVFAASIAADAVQACLGVVFMIEMIQRIFYGKRNEINGPAGYEGRRPRFALVLSAILLVGVLATYTPLRRIAALPLLVDSDCVDGGTSILTNLGSGTVGLTVTDPASSVQIYPPRIPATLFHDGLNPQAWYFRIFITTSLPATYLLTYQQQRGSSNVGKNHYVVWHGDLTGMYGKNVRICFDPKKPVANVPGLELHTASSVSIIGAPVRPD
jgi:hypothetical protein